MQLTLPGLGMVIHRDAMSRKLLVSYTKNNANAAKLAVEVKDASGNLLSNGLAEVSSQSVGTQADYKIDMAVNTSVFDSVFGSPLAIDPSNPTGSGLQAVQTNVSVDSYNTSAQISAANKLVLVKLRGYAAGDTQVTVKVDRQNGQLSEQINVPAGGEVNILTLCSGNVTVEFVSGAGVIVDVYGLDVASIPSGAKANVTVNVLELDTNGNTLDSGTGTVTAIGVKSAAAASQATIVGIIVYP